MGESHMLKLCCGLILLTFIVLSCEANGAPKPCGANEFYTDCGDNCQTECATLGEDCLIRHFRCPDGCYCNKGFARDSSQRCIPIAECPPKGNSY